MSKPVQAWAIVGLHGIIGASVRARQSQSIADWVGDKEGSKESAKAWRWWRRKYGYRCVRVLVTEEKQ